MPPCDGACATRDPTHIIAADGRSPALLPLQALSDILWRKLR